MPEVGGGVWPRLQTPRRGGAHLVETASAPRPGSRAGRCPPPSWPWGNGAPPSSTTRPTSIVFSSTTRLRLDRVRRAAQRISSVFTSLLARTDTRRHRIPVDADLRPEGKNGPWPGAWPPTPPTTKVGRAMGVRAAQGRHRMCLFHLGEDFARLAAGIVWRDPPAAAIRSIRE